MPITVLDGLTIEGCWGATILAGWAGLRREVTGVTVAEVPDSANWLQGGELVLTTAYCFRDEPEQFSFWVESMAQAGAVAIAVKQRRFLGDVPKQAITAMDRLGVPLIGLRHQVSWPAIIGPILHRQYGAVARSEPLPWWKEEFHRMLEGRRGLPTVAHTLAQLTGTPVLLQGMDLELRAVGLPPDPTCPSGLEWAQVLKERSASRSMTRVRQEVRRLIAERGAEPWKLESYAIPIGQGLVEHFHQLVNEEHPVGYLSVIQHGEEPDEGLRQSWQYAAAVTSLGFRRFALANERHLSQHARELLQSLTGDDDSSQLSEDVDRCLSVPGALAAVRMDLGVQGEDEGGGTAVPELGQGIVDVFLRDVQSWFRNWDHRSLVTYDRGIFLFTLPDEPSGPLGQRTCSLPLQERQRAWFKALRVFIESRGVGRVCAGISEPGQGRSFYRDAYQQCQESLRPACTPGLGESVVVWYENLGVLRLVAGIDSVETLQAFCRRYLGRLASPGDANERDRDLLKTLEVFFGCDGNLTRTAGCLFIHRNTLRYRLKRIGELVGVNPFTSEGQATLFIALRTQAFLAATHPDLVPSGSLSVPHSTQKTDKA